MERKQTAQMDRFAFNPEVSIAIEDTSDLTFDPYPEENFKRHNTKIWGNFNSPEHWRRNLNFVLIPFVMCGLPIGILEDTSNEYYKVTRNQDVYPWVFQLWFRFRFRSKLSAALTILLSPVYFGSMAYFIYLIVITLIKDMLWNGHFSLGNLYDIFNILTVGPFVMLINYMWLHGHAIGPLLRSFLIPISIPPVSPPAAADKFDSVASPLITKDSSDERESNATITPNEQNIISGLENNKRLQVNMVTIKTERELQRYRFYMVITYILWIVGHFFHYLIITHRFKVEKWPQDERNRHWVNFTCIIFYTFMLPVYSTFCYTILWKFHGLNEYIRAVMKTGGKLKMSHIFYIKKTYTKIADDIMHVNFLCRRFFLFVLLVLFTNMATNSYETIYFLIARFLGIFFEFIRAVLIHWGIIGAAGLDVGGGTVSSDIIGTEDLGIPPDVVRLITGMIVETLFYIYLIVTFLYDGIHVNDESRYLHVRLNDMASDLSAGNHHLYESFPVQVGEYKAFWFNKQNFINEDVYRAFFLLKQYMHSRMEAQAGKHRALLNIFGLSYYRPGITERFSSYSQSN